MSQPSSMSHVSGDVAQLQHMSPKQRAQDGTPWTRPSPWIIAEAGVNHNGDVGIAHRLMDLAKLNGADAVKFQIFRAAAVSSEKADLVRYQQRNSISGLSQREMLSALELPKSAWQEIASHATELGISFFATAFDLESLDVLLGLGVGVLKVSSGELTTGPLLRSVAACRLPTIISTGMANLDEVRRAVSYFPDDLPLAILHCTTDYPAPITSCNLRAITTLAIAFPGATIGWSDHTSNGVSALVAVGLGAQVFERHLTYDRGASGPDHAASSTPEEFRAYTAGVRAAASAMGTGEKVPHDSELEARLKVRRSWHSARDLQLGDVISDGDVVALRPATGMSAMVDLTGRVIRRPVAAGSVVVDDDIMGAE